MAAGTSIHMGTTAAVIITTEVEATFAKDWTA
jgi:hypothetical protein